MKRKFDIQRRGFALVAALFFCILGTKGQTETPRGTADLQGLYYIANYDSYSSSNSVDNWYLVPADDPRKSHYADAWFHNQYCTTSISNSNADYTGDNYGDPEKPFLTTYKTNKDAAAIPQNVTPREDNSIWILKEVSGESGYYYIIHASTGKYMIYEPPYQQATNRKSMHLQDIVSPSEPGNNAKFEVTLSSGNYNFRPKNVSSGNNKYFNPSGNPWNFYCAYPTTPGDYLHIGMIGLYTSGDNRSKWKMESTLCKEPTINYNSLAGSYTITWHGQTVSQLPSGYVIRYTDDDSEPSLTNGTDYDGSTIVVTQDNTTVKAIVIGHGMVLSSKATQVVNTAVPEAPTFEMTCDSKLQINCEVSTATLYYNYTTDGTDPADPDNTSTPYTAPVSLPDNAKVKAIAYNGSIASQVSPVYTVINNTPSPTIDLYETYAEITFGTGVTIHYTTDGSEPDSEDTGVSTSPYTLTFTDFDYDHDIEIRVVATFTGHPMSCPVTVAKRPKQPTIDASNECIGISRVQALAFTDTEEGKTYWYALSNGAGQSAPALNTFTEYTPGSTIDIVNIPAWNGTDVWVTLHACAMTADGFASHVVSQNYMLKYTDAPIITHSGNSVTITATTGATIHYYVDGGSQQTATTSVAFDVAAGQNHTITATAQLGSEGESCETVHAIVIPVTITTLQQLNNMTVNGAYVLGANIENAGSYTTKGTDANPFVGFFDGAGFTISGLTQPLFGITNGAVIHDVNLKEVQISGTDTLGAIACVAKGYTRIYSCGILPNTPDFEDNDHPSVSTTGNCAGSIVGSLRDDSRVVNCFSYADVHATNSAAGIVGRNECASDATVTSGKYTKLRTMVVNCMYYGNVTATSAYPVYGGRKISNAGDYAINNYNFYYARCTFNNTFTPTAYNCSWPALHEYLTRYEYHRYLLNSNRELCGWWVGAPFAPSTMTTTNVQAVPKDASLMAKWVLDPNVAPFPILKPFGYYPSPINIDADAEWRENAEEWEGKKLGTLSVTVNPGSHAANGVSSTTLSIVVTDMDTIHGDFCYRKIQLPYYNSVFGNSNSTDWTVKYAGNYKDYVVTGWDITDVTGGTTGELVQNWESGYNFADRDCTAKDSNRTFAQGGFYYVPNGVTAIEITAHWGKAVYLGNGDNYYDRADFDHLTDLVGNTDVVQRENHPGTAFAPAGTRPATFGAVGNEQTIRTGKIADVAATYIQSSGTVYDNALVLVGNHQYCTGKEDVNPSCKFTIMSADFDLDNEPDYCLEWQLGQGTTRQNICPIRFDFLPVEEIGLCLKKDGSTQYYSLGCYYPQGHFEVTETSLIRFGQFEFGNKVNPLILNGGIYDQYCKGTVANDAGSDKNNYIILGGNIYMPSFTPGAHVRVAKTTRHCAVNVIGGKIDYLYLTGNYNENITNPYADDPHCYIDGGWFDHVAAAGKEGIGNTSNSDKGNVTWKINHSRIKEFYGGGIMSTSHMIVRGNIDVTIDNSRVYKYCGGPKFGDMVSGKTVKTTAKGTYFGVYYGAGNGGTNYVQYDNSDGTRDNPNSFNWGGTGKVNAYHPGEYRGDEKDNYMANYDMEMINVSTGTYFGRAVIRTYFYAAQYAATNTGAVTNKLTGCTVETSFYGAGKLGGVIGNVESTLKDTEVKGSAFGAGYSADIPEVTIYEKTKVVPSINLETGLITPQVEGNTPGVDFNTYTWTHETSLGGQTLSTAHPAVMNVTVNGVTKNYFYTKNPLEDLGKVEGNVTLTIKGSSVIGTSGDATTGMVFGGGDQSKVQGNTTVILQGGAHVLGNVFGGGNSGEVSGDASVTIEPQPADPNPGEP